MLPDLTVRAVDVRELMDGPDADLRMLERTYLQFHMVNRAVSRPGLLYRRDIRPRARSRPLRILDIGAGGGDLCRMIAARLRRDGLDAEITALDADERAVTWASRHDGGAGIRYVCAHTSELVRAGEAFDVVLSNHLLHHLSGDELMPLLADSARLTTRGGIVVHRDIVRSRAAYLLFAAGTTPFALNLFADSFIRADGLTSIRRSYTARELTALVPGDWQVRAGVPFRLELRWERDDARP